jgi:Rps23 Pro-64 3,4-dihydroxylase Tpa1-like proline 4-hydroxylase
MNFVNINNLEQTKYNEYPFPHTIIDNFLKEDVVEKVLTQMSALEEKDAESKFIDPKSPYEYNKYAWNNNFGPYLKELFAELNSPEFILYLEKLTGISGLITNDTSLRGAGIHRILKGGYLKLHTDFNTYFSEKHGNLDRRLNLLIYMNPDWKEEYNGQLCLCDKENSICVDKIMPIMNRCVIFNTSSKSIHGHPDVLNTPQHISRQSIAVYYYTKNLNGGTDFEGLKPSTTKWFPNIKT